MDDELFPLSWLSQYGYCPRRCGLLALEQQWAESADTAAGRSQHQKVHTARTERRGEKLFLYELSVFSRELGVNGKCDCVEAWEDPAGIPLPYSSGTYSLFPIEYKHGVLRQEEEYHIQLCAQAMCMEYQFQCVISKGAIFYLDSHRRQDVIFTPELREKTWKTAQSVKHMLESQQLPVAKFSSKCQKCSMLDICQPKLKGKVGDYCQNLWNALCSEDSV